MLGGLKANPLPWLLEEDDPSVRYSTLVDILDAPPHDRRVVAAKKAIMETGIVPKILAKQKKGGFWEKAEDFYIRTKYTGTVWQLIILAELGAGGNDPKVQSACDFVLRFSQDPESGGAEGAFQRPHQALAVRAAPRLGEKATGRGRGASGSGLERRRGDRALPRTLHRRDAQGGLPAVAAGAADHDARGPRAARRLLQDDITNCNA